MAYLKNKQQKALTRVLKRIAKKHRVKSEALDFVYSPSLNTGPARVGSEFYVPSTTNRDVKRIKGMLPELRAALAKAATACGWTGGLDYTLIENIINI